MMFIPAAFRVDDWEEMYSFMERYSFATLVSIHEGTPWATHVPLLVDRTAKVLLGHVSRGNPHWQAFTTDTETLAIFHGPHAYISPTWYTTTPAVPTWNYATVHVYGVARVVDADETRTIVERTVRQYEGRREQPWTYDLPAEFRERLLAGIVGFVLPMARLEGKYKLGQNRSAADQTSMLNHLRQGDADEQQLADMMQQRR